MRPLVSVGETSVDSTRAGSREWTLNFGVGVVYTSHTIERTTIINTGQGRGGGLMERLKQPKPSIGTAWTWKKRSSKPILPHLEELQGSGNLWVADGSG